MAPPLKMLLVGAGLMGRTHLEEAGPYSSVDYAGVVAVNAGATESFGAEFGLKAFTDLEQAIADIQPDAVDVCIPTAHHLALVKTCARHNLHVLCEKPVALTCEDAAQMRSLSGDAGIRLMIAQVLRFWPEYVYALESVKDGRYGTVLSVDCRRLSSPPAWNSWMMKAGQGEGAVIDLQIHDMDFVLQLLGPPAAIQATGRLHEGAHNAVTNRLIYHPDVSATIQASFLMPETYPFRMYFQIELEQAILEFDFWRAKGERLKVYPKDGEAFCPPVETTDAYGAEIDYFCRCVLEEQPFSRVLLDESIAALAMCLTSRESCRCDGKPVAMPRGHAGPPRLAGSASSADPEG
ncbi:MAG: Gfo/Idh/MocA family oxidoreductase [Lentisphaerae bacterium]|nr:Gfo/Idh/MocA family oxidoreductase [Lentisphaerota bacterium]